MGASGHFLGKIAFVLSLAEGLHGGVEILVRLAVGGGAGGEVGAHLVRRSVAVGGLTHNGLLGKAGWLGAALLLLGRAAKHQHTGGHNVLRQAQGLAHGLGVFNHVPDIAAADAQALGGGHGVLRGDAGVRHGQHQIAVAGLARIRHTGRMVDIQPAAAVGQKHQHQRCLGNERLMVAQVGQCGLQRGVGDVQNCVQLLVARCGGLKRRVQDGRALLGGDGLVREHTDAFAGGEGR